MKRPRRSGTTPRSGSSWWRQGCGAEEGRGPQADKKGIVAGGVLPGYADHKDDMSAEDYLAKVAAGELYDATLTFQIENGFQPRAVLNDYMQDETVDNHACLIVWDNPDYRADDAG